MVISPLEHNTSHEAADPNELLIKEARQRTRRRRAQLGSIVLVVVAAVALVVAIIGHVGATRGPSAPISAADSGSAHPSSGEAASLVNLNEIAASGSSIWVSTLKNSVVQLSASTGDIVRVIDAKSYRLDSPAAMVVNDGDLWVANDTDPSVTEINAKSGKLIRVVDGPPGGFGYISGIAANGSSIWISGKAGDKGAVFELNATTGRLVRTIDASADGFRSGNTEIPVVEAASGSFVWVLNENGTTITELNASSGALVRVLNADAGPSTAANPSGPTSLAQHGSDVWVTDRTTTNFGTSSIGKVVEFDALTGRAVLEIDSKEGVPPNPRDVAIDGNRVWVLNEGTSPATTSISEFNASTGARLRVISGDSDGLSNPSALIVSSSDVMVLNINSGQRGSVTVLNKSGTLLRVIK